MRVMDVRAHARVPVFEKAHVRMKRIHITCNGKYTGQRQRRRGKSSLAYIDSYSR